MRRTHHSPAWTSEKESYQWQGSLQCKQTKREEHVAQQIVAHQKSGQKIQISH